MDKYELIYDASFEDFLATSSVDVSDSLDVRCGGVWGIFNGSFNFRKSVSN